MPPTREMFAKLAATADAWRNTDLCNDLITIVGRFKSDSPEGYFADYEPQEALNRGLSVLTEGVLAEKYDAWYQAEVVARKEAVHA